MTKLRRTRSVGRFDHAPWSMPWEDGLGADEEHEAPTAHVIRMAGELGAGMDAGLVGFPFSPGGQLLVAGKAWEGY